VRSPGTLARSYSSFAILPTIAREGGLAVATFDPGAIGPVAIQRGSEGTFLGTPALALPIRIHGSAPELDNFLGHRR
jgi:hypothetical protein